MRLSTGHGHGAVKVLLVLAFLSGGVTSLPLADAQLRGDVAALLDEGLSLYEQRRLDEAEKKMEQALLLDIGAEEAYTWLERIGLEKALEMARKGGQTIEGQISTLIRLSAVETRRRERDADAVREVLASYFGSTDFMERTRAIMKGVSMHGVYLLPGLVERLSAPEIDTRVSAISAITKISDDAVLPLCQALHHTESSVLLGVIASLKKIGNDAAIPSLSWLSATTDDLVVKGAADAALEALDGDMMARKSTAYDLLVAEAGRYFRDTTYMTRTYHDPLIWTLQDGVLTYQDVAAWRLNELRAEQLLAVAMTLDSGAAPARVLNACSKFAQYAEFQGVRDLLASRVAAGQEDESKLTELRAQELDMNRIRYQFPASQPVEILLGALSRALDERRGEVAVEVLQTLRDAVTLGNREAQLPAEVQRALSYEHRGVRFAAAETASRMNPVAVTQEDSQLVVQNLCEGLTEAGIRVALLIVPNEDDSLLIAGTLRKSGVLSFTERTGWDGVERAKSFPPEDLIIVAAGMAGGKSPTGMLTLGTAEVINRLRADFRTKDIPILVLSSDEQYTANQTVYLDEARNVQVINRGIDAVRLRDDIVLPLFSGDTNERGRGDQIAARAAEALLFLAGRDTAFDLTTAEGALVSVLENRADEVRIAASRALGALRTQRATPSLVRICQDQSVSQDLLKAALIALGDINRGAGGQADQSMLDLLDSMYGHENPEIVKVSAASRGKIAKATMRE
ncbi:MAG: HEAT repeat domain-containing protein [Planctomycetota bacterium]